ncbi:MAG TPA: hypothetical protein VMU88_10315 [bacterium]|nr:hypothetical protein [bacterium]
MPVSTRSSFKNAIPVRGKTVKKKGKTAQWTAQAKERVAPNPSAKESLRFLPIVSMNSSFKLFLNPLAQIETTTFFSKGRIKTPVGP